MVENVEIPTSMVRNTDLSNGALRLYTVLALRWQRDGVAYVPHRDLARECGVSLRMIRHYIVELRDRGYIREVPAGWARTKIYAPVPIGNTVRIVAH